MGMSQANHDPGWIDAQRFNENRNRVPAEELRRHAGLCVAWNRDGTRILASGPDMSAAEEALRTLGIDPSEVVWSSIPARGEDTWL
jgi:hypothetical protein